MSTMLVLKLPVRVEVSRYFWLTCCMICFWTICEQWGQSGLSSRSKCCGADTIHKHPYLTLFCCIRVFLHDINDSSQQILSSYNMYNLPYVIHYMNLECIKMPIFTKCQFRPLYIDLKQWFKLMISINKNNDLNRTEIFFNLDTSILNNFEEFLDL